MIGAESFDEATLYDGFGDYVCAGVGAAVGCAAGVMLVQDPYSNTAGLILIAYVLCSTFPVVMVAYKGGPLRGLLVAIWSLIYGLVSIAAVGVFLAVLAVPLALLVDTGPGRAYQEWFPNTWMLGVGFVLEYILAAAALALIFRSERATAIAVYAFGGFQYLWIGAGIIVAGFVGLALFFLCGGVVWLFEGWPPGWLGITLALVVGGGAGAVHGYFTGTMASSLVAVLD